MPIEQGYFGWRYYGALQDDAGFVWFATRYGLLRYDGYSFTPLERDPDDSTSVLTTWSGDGFMYKDIDGSFWFATAAGLEHFDPTTRRVLARYVHDPDNATSVSGRYISAFLRDTHGRYWVGTSMGLDLFDPEMGTFRHIYDQDSTGEGSVAIGWVRAIEEDPYGTLWIAVAGGQHLVPDDRNRLIGGVLRFDPATQSFRRYTHDTSAGRHTHDTEAEAILVDRRGTVWFGMWGEDGLHQYDRDHDRIIHLPYDPDRPDALSAPRQRDAIVHGNDPLGPGIRFLYEDAEGIIWIGGFKLGLNRYNPITGAMQHYEAEPQDPGSLVEDSIWGMLETSEGTKWILTWGGINRIRSTVGRFDFYRYKAPETPPISDGRIAAVFEDTRNQLWLGTVAGGLNRVDRASGTVQIYRNDPADTTSLGFNFVYDVAPFVSDSTQLWVSTTMGRSSLDVSTGRFVNYDTDFLDGHPDFFQIPDVAGTRAGSRFHIKSAWGSGLRICDRATGACDAIEQSDQTGGLPDAFITTAYCDRRDVCWFGTRNAGLLELIGDGDMWRFQRHLPEKNWITAIHERANGDLWVSSFLGLFWRNGEGAWHRLTSSDGLPSTIVSHLVPHGEDEIWIVTTAGVAVYRFSTGQIRSYAGETEHQKNFLWTSSIYQNARGEIIVGGLNGFLVFHPDRVKALDNHIPPIVHVEKLVGTSGHPAQYVSNRDPRFSYEDRDIDITFTGLHYDNPDKIRYAYRLAGYDQDWVDAGTRRSAHYARLPSGRYTFEVRAANPDGLWSESVVYPFGVAPPFWRHPVAYVLYLIFMGGGIYLVYSAQRNRLIQRERLASAQERALLIEQLDRTKSRFFVNLSHEFRTPLTLLLGPVRDALDGAYGELDPRFHGQLGAMHRAADRLHRLINQLLDLAKLEAGGMRLEARQGDLVAFVRALTLSFASRAEREGKHLQLDTHAEAAEVYFDRDKLEKIVYNLLSNAFKFTAAGGKIRVSVAASEGSARIVVRDTGEGIPAGELPHIFDRFHQADASPTRRHEGSGIGLSLAKELAELHGGTLTAESQQGFGSAFTLTLPLGRAHLRDEDLIAEETLPQVDKLDAADPVQQILSRASSLSAQVSPPTATILLVDDNADVRAYLKSHLAGYRILEAEDGEAGLALAIAESPDLVISDVMMPKLDGYGLCAALRKDRRTQDIPVVLLTAKAAEENKLEGLGAGADDYLYKPFSARELLARTENLIYRRKQLKAKYRQEVVLKPTEITVTSADAAWLEKVRGIVEAQMGDGQFGVERLAEEVGLGRRQLQRKMNELTGGTTHRFIQELRLERARQLLEQQAGNVSEVAYRVGFRDPRHFARLFQQQYGKPPSRWR
ncbi:MAG: ATP-binding protein [Rhodothermales bacterium]